VCIALYVTTLSKKRGKKFQVKYERERKIRRVREVKRYWATISGVRGGEVG